MENKFSVPRIEEIPADVAVIKNGSSSVNSNGSSLTNATSNDQLMKMLQDIKARLGDSINNEKNIDKTCQTILNHQQIFIDQLTQFLERVPDHLNSNVGPDNNGDWDSIVEKEYDVSDLAAENAYDNYSQMETKTTKANPSRSNKTPTSISHTYQLQSIPEFERVLKSLIEVLEVVSTMPENLPFGEINKSIDSVGKKLNSLNTNLPEQITLIKTSLSNMYQSLNTIHEAQMSQLSQLSQVAQVIHTVQANQSTQTAQQSNSKKTNAAVLSTKVFAAVTIINMAILFIFFTYNFYAVKSEIRVLNSALPKSAKVVESSGTDTKAVVEIKDNQKKTGKAKP